MLDGGVQQNCGHGPAPDVGFGHDLSKLLSESFDYLRGKRDIVRLSSVLN